MRLRLTPHNKETYMAYAINNITPFGPNAIPLNIVTLADQSADVAAQDMTVSGC